MKSEYQGCRNCKNQPDSFKTCEWLKHQEVFHRRCPRWVLKGNNDETELTRWNYERHEYEPHRIPTEWYVSLFESDMERVVNCAHCGSEIVWGNTYTSLEIHNQMGFGYGVCERCYREEVERRRKSEE